MSIKKKTVNGTGTAINGQGMENAPAVSTIDFTTKRPMKSIVSEYLGKGKENAVPMDRLAGMLGVSERRIRRFIADERKRGILILSGNEGYYLPNTVTAEGREDAEHYVRTMKARARHSWACAYVAEKALNELSPSGG